MSSKKAILFFCTLFFSTGINAQRVITGRLIDFHSKEVAAGVWVMVFKSPVFAETDDRGYFQLTVNPGDSILIAHQDYTPAIIPVPESDVFILYVEKRYVYPVYLSGEAVLYKYLREHIKYPPFAGIRSREEFVLVELSVDTTGHISGSEVINEVSKEFEKTVLAVFEGIPGDWSAGPQMTKLIFPVFFKSGRESTEFEIPKLEIPEGKFMDHIVIYPQ